MNIGSIHSARSWYPSDGIRELFVCMAIAISLSGLGIVLIQ